ncbi:MAG: phosphatase PAP2 family protein, partial [Planctomycetota bacterium]
MPEAREREAGLTATDALHALVLGTLLALSPLVVSRTDAGWWLPVGFAALAAALLAVVASHRARPSSRALGFAHLWYPGVYVVLVFWSLFYVIPAVNPGGLRDDMLIEWDRGLLGGDAVAWFRELESPLLTDVMHVVYASYFLLPVALVVWLLLLGKRSALRETIFVLSLSFYLCYVGYAFVPAQGPRYAIYGTNEMEGLLLTQPLRDAIDALEPSKADIFPSAHAALTLVVTVLALRHAPKLGRPL